MDRRLFASWVVAWVVTLGGCGSRPLARPSGPPPDSSGLAPGTLRGRMGDPKPNLLDLKPDDPGSREDRGARIRALVNGQAILEEEVQASALPLLPGVRSEAEKAEILN
ncbi:MAG: hypothetical protein K2W96_19000, partial [Gemmataceae bacterium]|nr:hypothetical protein [Gemmataceae bacterium]